jgi:hypothetical protein
MSARDRIAERVFAMLLRGYPVHFRTEYGREMTQLFRDQRRMDDAAGARFWAETVRDVAASAWALRVDALRAARKPQRHAMEVTMRLMAILAVLVGLIQVVNAMIEAMAGRSQSGDAYSLVGVALGLVAAAILVAAGVAMLRRGSDAAVWARVAAVVCIAAVVLIRIIQPWMSIFGTLLGVGFPIALLVFLSVRRRSGPPGPMTA